MLEPFQWSEELQTGILWQDYQHKELIDQISLLHKSISLGIDSKQIDDTCSFLSNYVNQHFGIEERYMEKHSYPEREEHQKQHAIFIDYLILLNEHRQGQDEEACGVESTALCEKLFKWFIKHIQTYDKRLSTFLHECNGQP